MENNASKSYTNGEITVIWQPEKCWHAAECVSNLPKVFDINRRPWVDINGAASKEIAATIDLCPSGALTYEWNVKKL